MIKFGRISLNYAKFDQIMEGLFFEHEQLKINLKRNKKALKKEIEKRFPIVFSVSDEIFYDRDDAQEYFMKMRQSGSMKEIKTSKVQLKLLLVRLPVKKTTTSVQIGSIKAEPGSVFSIHGHAFCVSKTSEK